MKIPERTVLIGSIALNVVLLITVLFLWQRSSPPTPPTTTAVAAITATSVSPTPTTPQETAVPTTAATALPSEPTATPTEEPTAVPTPETSPEATSEPTTAPTVEPTVTAAPLPTETPEPTAVPADTAVLTGPNWLRYVNQFRLEANLPLVTENAAWSQGAANHSFYMVLNSDASHNEQVNAMGYTPEGAEAGTNGNIAISGSTGVGYTWPVDYWMSASFHALPLLDPELQQVGYGEYRDPASSFGLAATIDVNRGLRGMPADVQFPLTFPQDGGQTWVTTFSLPEFPNTIAGCSGYTQPTGAPLIIQMGGGDETPRVTSSEILRDGQAVAHCVFTEATYTNSNSYWQGIGRKILDERDAIILVPRSPLETGKSYTVTVVANGQEISWQFDVVAGPPTS